MKSINYTGFFKKKNYKQYSSEVGFHCSLKNHNEKQQNTASPFGARQQKLMGPTKINYFYFFYQTLIYITKQCQVRQEMSCDEEMKISEQKPDI